MYLQTRAVSLLRRSLSFPGGNFWKAALFGANTVKLPSINNKKYAVRLNTELF